VNKLDPNGNSWFSDGWDAVFGEGSFDRTFGSRATEITDNAANFVDYAINPVGAYQGASVSDLLPDIENLLDPELSLDYALEVAGLIPAAKGASKAVSQAFPSGSAKTGGSGARAARASGETRHGYYEPNPKHDVNRPGVGPQPKDPVCTLDNSYPVPNKAPAGSTQRRIGYDKDNKEIVVFREHETGRSHGYAKTWDNLLQTERNALIDAGVFTPKGRVR
jgi:hypothetical protein